MAVCLPGDAPRKRAKASRSLASDGDRADENDGGRDCDCRDSTQLELPPVDEDGGERDEGRHEPQHRRHRTCDDRSEDAARDGDGAELPWEAEPRNRHSDEPDEQDGSGERGEVGRRQERSLAASDDSGEEDRRRRRTAPRRQSSRTRSRERATRAEARGRVFAEAAAAARVRAARTPRTSPPSLRVLPGVCGRVRGGRTRPRRGPRRRRAPPRATGGARGRAARIRHGSRSTRATSTTASDREVRQVRIHRRRAESDAESGLVADMQEEDRDRRCEHERAGRHRRRQTPLSPSGG